MKHVVVIEDDPWLGEHFQRTIERAGYRVSLARDGVAAIDLIDEIVPDIIILDVLLAQSTAPALLHELQSHRDLASIPVVLVTNIASRIDHESMKRYGVHMVLDKAVVTPDQLVQHIEKLL